MRSLTNDAARRAASRYGAPYDTTRDARANAAIIRPFHAVSTLSSRCGLGRDMSPHQFQIRFGAERTKYDFVVDPVVDLRPLQVLHDFGTDRLLEVLIHVVGFSVPFGQHLCELVRADVGCQHNDAFSSIARGTGRVADQPFVQEPQQSVADGLDG